MRPGLGFDVARFVAVDHRAAVEVQAKTVLPAVGPVGGQAALDVRRQIWPFHLHPMHGRIFKIAQPAFFKVDAIEHARHVGRLAKRRRQQASSVKMKQAVCRMVR